jgi:hypothetical protein
MMNCKQITRFLAIALLLGCQVLLMQCGAAPVVVPADIIDNTSGVLPGDPYPRISTVQPDDGALNVPLNSNYVIVFSLPVDATTIAGGISVTSSSTGALTFNTNYTISVLLTGQTSYSTLPATGTTTSAVITFNPFGTGTPACPIPVGDTISVTINSSITSSGQPIHNPKTYTFTVMGALGFPDTTSPTAQISTESPAGSGVSLTPVISIQFTEASGLDNSSINPDSFYIIDSLFNIIPCTRLVTGTAPTWTVTLTPSQTLLSGRLYNVTIDGTKVRDLSGNILGGTITWNFTTINTDPYAFLPGFQAGFPRVDSVEATGTEATISWDTTKPVSSVLHYGRDNNNPPTGGTDTKLSYVTSSFADITGLTSGKQYYFRTDITDSSANTYPSPVVGAFITPTTETPVAVQAIAGNQTIAFAGERTRSVGNSGALVIWSDIPSIPGNLSLHAQLYDNSFTPLWGAGKDLFTESGHDYTFISSTEDFIGDFIVLALRNTGEIYAKRISSAGGVFDWGTGSQNATDPGVQITAAGASHAWAVPVYSGMFSNVTNGTTTMNYSATNYLYDPSDDFSSGSATTTGDVVMDTTTHAGTTVSLTNFRYILNQAAANITVSDHYMVGDGNTQFQSGLTAENHAMFGGTNYTSATPAQIIYTTHSSTPLPAWLANNDIIKSVASGLYGQVNAFTTISPSSYESNSMTHVTGHLFDGTGTPFSGIAAGDLVQNTVSLSYAHVTSKLSNNDLLLDSDIFPTNGEGYAVFHLLESSTLGTALIPNRMIKTQTRSASVGYFVWNQSLAKNTIATVANQVSSTELVLTGGSLLGDIFTATNDLYRIYTDTVQTSGTTSTVGPTSNTITDLSAHFFTTVYPTGTAVYPPFFGVYLIKINGQYSRILSCTDTVLTLEDTVTVSSGQVYTIYPWFEGGSNDGSPTANAVVPKKLYKSGASWTVSIGDVVEKPLPTSTYATVSAAGTGVNELLLATSLFGSGTDNYIIYNKLPTGTSQMFLGNHLTRASATWPNTTVGYLVYNTSLPAVATVSTWLTSTDLLLNLGIFTVLGQSYSMFSDYCTTDSGIPSTQPFGSITADWNIGITNTNTFNLYHYRAHTGTATALPVNPLFANAADFSVAGVSSNDYVFNITNPSGANFGRVLSLPNQSALSLTSATFTDGQTFNIFRDGFNAFALDTSRVRTYGMASSLAIGVLYDTTNTFTAPAVIPGDYVYDITTSQYAIVTAVAATALTLWPSTQTININDRYIVIRQRNVLYVWQNGTNILGRVISYEKLGALIIPTDVNGTLALPLTLVSNAQNPYAFSDEAGGSILVYENNVSGQIDVQLLNGMGNLITSIIADTSHGTQTIMKVIPDGHGGVIILYKYGGGTSLAAQWVRNNSGLFRQWGAGGSLIVTASTSDEDFAYYYNAGSPYIIAVWVSANNIFASRVGNGAWATTQMTNIATSVKDKPHIFLNGATTLITWEDYRWTNIVGYGIYGLKIDAASGTKLAAWHANNGGTNDWNGIPLMMNKYNKNSVNNLIVPFDRFGTALPTKMQMIWEDTRNKTSNAIDIFSSDVSSIVP